MAEELSQSGFDKTIKKLQADVELAGDGIERSIEDQSVVLERVIGRAMKGILAGLDNATGLVETIAVTQQQTVLDQEIESEKNDKQNRFLLSNMVESLKGLLVVSFKTKLSDTKRQREEKRTSDALIGVLTDVGAGLSNIKSGLLDALKLATNPLGLIGAIVGVSIGIVGGLFALISTKLNLPGLLKGLRLLIGSFFSPKSKLGKAIVFAIQGFVKRISSFIKVFATTSAFILKQIPLVEKLFAFMKPFIKFGRVLSKAFLPLTVAIAIFQGIRGVIKDVKEGGDALSATLAGLGEILDFLTFGVLNTKILKKVFEEPIRMFIEGIKEIFTDGFSIKSVTKIFEGLTKFLLSAPDLIIQATGNLTATIANVLGFKDFAKNLKAFLSDFNLFTFFTDGIQSVIDFFAGIPAALAQLPEIFNSIKESLMNSVKAVFNKFADDPLGTIKEIGESIVSMFSKLVDGVISFVINLIPRRFLSDELKAVKDRQEKEKEDAEKLAALKEEFGVETLQEAEQARDRQSKLAALRESQNRVANLFDKALRTGDKKTQALLQERSTQIRDEIAAIKNETKSKPEVIAERIVLQTPLSVLKFTAASNTAVQLAEQMVMNANLRDKAAAPTVIAPVSSSTVVQQGGNQPVPIIVPLSLRNGENTLQRVADGNFRGSMPR